MVSTKQYFRDAKCSRLISEIEKHRVLLLELDTGFNIPDIQRLKLMSPKQLYALRDSAMSTISKFLSLRGQS